MAAMPRLNETSPDAMQRARDAALLWRATNLAIEGAFRFGRDLPVGAVAAAGDWVVGRFFASDMRTGFDFMHAEHRAVLDAKMDRFNPPPDTVVVTAEPCDNCQDFLAGQSTIRRVAFGLTREELAARGLVKPHSENIFSRALRIGLPYEVAQVDDPDLLKAGRVILDHVVRDINTGLVTVNQQTLHEALVALNEEG